MRIPCIFDADSLFARHWFAAETDPMQDQREFSTLLVIRAVASLLNPVSGRLPETPTEMLFCWDGPIPKKDKHREPKSQRYIDTKKALAGILTRVFGSSHCFPTGEADDAVATSVTRLGCADDVKTIYVVSGDKDLQQLVDDKVVYYSLNEKSVFPWSAICNKWKVKHPSHVAIALAILGDASDAIDGIKGWGPKKVESLFSSVTAEMPLLDVAELMTRSMKPPQLATFIASLDLTCLIRDIPDDVPEPASVVICDSDVLNELNLNQVVPMLQAIRSSNHVRNSVTQDFLD